MDKVIVGVVGIGLLATAFGVGLHVGEDRQKAKLPSCLYLDRPGAVWPMNPSAVPTNGILPFGCDNKPGIDWQYDKISGGGLYVSLHPWKQ